MTRGLIHLKNHFEKTSVHLVRLGFRASTEAHFPSYHSMQYRVTSTPPGIVCTFGRCTTCSCTPAGPFESQARQRTLIVGDLPKPNERLCLLSPETLSHNGGKNSLNRSILQGHFASKRIVISLQLGISPTWRNKFGPVQCRRAGLAIRTSRRRCESSLSSVINYPGGKGILKKAP